MCAKKKMQKKLQKHPSLHSSRPFDEYTPNKETSITEIWAKHFSPITTLPPLSLPCQLRCHSLRSHCLNPLIQISLSLFSTINGRLRNPPPPPPSNPKRNSLPGSEHHNPAPLREDPREKALHRPPKEGAPQALPAILHLLGPCLLGPGSVPSPPVPPLLGTHHTPLALPPDLLRFSGANPEVHQWVQVPEALPQAHAWAGHWEAEGDEDKSQWCCRRWWPLWRCWWRWVWDSLPRASWELLWQVQEELGFAFWLLDLDLWIYGLVLCCPPLFLAVRFLFFFF